MHLRYGSYLLKTDTLPQPATLSAGNHIKPETGNPVQQVSGELQYIAGEVPKGKCSLPSDCKRARGNSGSWDYGTSGHEEDDT